jgi:hypothetical protein
MNRRSVMTFRIHRIAALVAGTVTVGLILCGCASYSTPGGPASFRALNITEQEVDEQTEAPIARRLDLEPLAGFPSTIAVARVQAPGYRSYSADSYGRGAYSIVTVRDVETDEHFNRIRDLPMIRGLAPLNRIVLDEDLYTDRELREGAAAVHADMLLIYTFDTSFDIESTIPPLSLISIGLIPETEARVRSTVSGALMDTLNGYVYGLLEGSAQDDQLANAWTSRVAVDQVRRRTEAEAFAKMVDSFEPMWRGVVQAYGPQPAKDG